MDWVSVLTRSRDFGEELVKPPLFLPDLPSSHYHCLEGKPFFYQFSWRHMVKKNTPLFCKPVKRERERNWKKNPSTEATAGRVELNDSNTWPAGATVVL
jgi:hypothetical protein